MGRYSLWLIPDRDTERRMAETIELLSRDLGGPRFEPHMTLLGGIEGAQACTVSSTERLAAAIDPITLRIRNIEFGDQPYRCLYLRVAGSRDLLAAHREALRQFGRSSDPSFVPHISLFYGTLPRTIRAGIAATLTDWRSSRCQAARIRLVATGGGPASWHGILDRALRAPRQAG